MNNIEDLYLPYPDFKLQEIIDPEQFDINNEYTVIKMNQVLEVLNQIVNSIEDGQSGADLISLTPIPGFSSDKLQMFLEDFVQKLNTVNGSAFIGTPALDGMPGLTVKEQLSQMKGIVDAIRSELSLIINNSGNPEVIIARGGYAFLAERLDALDSFIAQRFDAIDDSIGDVDTNRIGSPNQGTPVDTLWVELERREVNIQWFSHLVVDGDWTVACQTAHNLAHRRMYFPNDGTVYKLGKVYISKKIEIDLMGNELLGLSTAIWCLSANTNYLKIHGTDGVRFLTSGGAFVTGVQGREFFVDYSRNGVFGENITTYPDPVGTVTYSAKKLILKNNVLGYAKVSVMGTDTVSHIQENNWSNDVTVIPSPYALCVKKGAQGIVAVFKSGLHVQDNVFNMYTANGTNCDILKVSGGIKNAKIVGNHFENQNKLSTAQVDVYTGAHRMRFINNTMINVQLHRKQEKGSSTYAPYKYGYDFISGNETELEEGHNQVTAYYMVGSLFTMLGNQIEIRNTNALVKTGIYLENSTTLVGEFNTDSAMAFILANNTVDFRGSGGKCYFLYNSAGTISGAPKYFVNQGNLMIGGTRFMYGSAEAVSALGNVWLNSEGGESTGFGSSPKGIFIGNIADTDKALIAGKTTGNHAPYTVTDYPITGSMALDVSARSFMKVSGGGTITGFTGGTIGQEIKLHTGVSGVTIQANASIKLNGTVNAVIPNRGSITLTMGADSIWIEDGRNMP